MGSKGWTQLDGGGGRIGGYGGAVSKRCNRDAISCDLVSNVPYDSSADERQASMPLTLSSVCCIINSNPSNFFASSSMVVIIVVSNLVGFRGASSRHQAQVQVPQLS